MDSKQQDWKELDAFRKWWEANAETATAESAWMARAAIPIDDETREALEAAVMFFDSFKDYRVAAHDPEKDHMAKLIQEAHQFVIEKHIAALQRLLDHQ